MYECMNVNDIGGGMQLDLSCRVFLDNVAAESELYWYLGDSVCTNNNSTLNLLMVVHILQRSCPRTPLDRCDVRYSDISYFAR